MWLRRLPTDRIERRLPAPAETPRIVVQNVKSALRVYARNDAAVALGISTGAPLADVCAMYPLIAIEHADISADQTLLEAIADWCDRYTPLVALDPPDGLFLDISGCAHLFGGEAALAGDLQSRLARQGLKANFAVAPTFGAAWALSRYGEVRHAQAGRVRAVLDPLPIAALRVEKQTVDALARAGLKTVADLAERPRAPLAARFGQQLLRRLDQAFGTENESVSPRLPIPAYIAERRFPDPIGRDDDVLGAIEQLAHELSQIMERRGEGARVLQAALFRADGKVYRIETASSAPLRDPQRIRQLFVERLAIVGDECDPGFGYDMVRLAALTAEPMDEVQQGLAGDDLQKELTQFVDRLSTRFGPQRLVRLVPQNTHIPERAVAFVPAQAAFKKDLPAVLSNDDVSSTRPVRLLLRSERVEALAEVPDGPPVRFYWRRLWHNVVRSEGPERVAMEWWQPSRTYKLTRDYFRVESREGARVWLYRDGLYGREMHHDETWRPVWYVHGFFA